MLHISLFNANATGMCNNDFRPYKQFTIGRRTRQLLLIQESVMYSVQPFYKRARRRIKSQTYKLLGTGIFRAMVNSTMANGKRIKGVAGNRSPLEFNGTPATRSLRIQTWEIEGKENSNGERSKVLDQDEGTSKGYRRNVISAARLGSVIWTERQRSR